MGKNINELLKKMKHGQIQINRRPLKSKEEADEIMKKRKDKKTERKTAVIPHDGKI